MTHSLGDEEMAADERWTNGSKSYKDNVCIIVKPFYQHTISIEGPEEEDISLKFKPRNFHNNKYWLLEYST